jgi:hypothetical protein
LLARQASCFCDVCEHFGFGRSLLGGSRFCHEYSPFLIKITKTRYIHRVTSNSPTI